MPEKNYDFGEEKTETEQNTVKESPAPYGAVGYTVDFIENLPDGVRAELIDGRIFYMASPSRVHQELVSELLYRISSYIRQKGGVCKVYPSPFAVYLFQDNKNYVEPDLVVVCDPNKLTDKGVMGAPDWVVEIVSPSSESMDYIIKLVRYRSAGVREYWIVDPRKKEIAVHNFEKEERSCYGFLDQIKAGIYENLTIDFSEITREIMI